MLPEWNSQRLNEVVKQLGKQGQSLGIYSHSGTAYPQILQLSRYRYVTLLAGLGGGGGN